MARNERALRKLDGVDEANVNFATEKATVVFDPAVLTARDLVESVKKAGYDVVTRRETLPILGMTCASCVGRVERALKKAPGVVDADVNLATERATVTYVPGETDRAALVAAVRAAGYDVAGGAAEALPGAAAGGGVEAAEEALDAEQAARAAAYRGLRRKVVVGFVLSTVIFVGTMQPHWFPFLPDWLHNGYLLWALATPVQFWVGRQFYTAAWAGLRHGFRPT